MAKKPKYEHSQAPWSVTAPGQFHENACIKAETPVGENDVLAIMISDREADARLMAAAPEMAAVLQGVMEDWLDGKFGNKYGKERFEQVWHVLVKALHDPHEAA